MAKKVCLQVNRAFLPIKFFYFFAFAGIGTVVPFIAIFMRHLGLTASETGIIMGLMPFMAFFTQMFIGPTADHFNCQKQANIFFFLLMAASLLAMLFVPHGTIKSPRMFSGDMTCLIDPHFLDHRVDRITINCSVNLAPNLAVATEANDLELNDTILCLYLTPISDCEPNATESQAVDWRDNVNNLCGKTRGFCFPATVFTKPWFLLKDEVSRDDNATNRRSPNTTICDNVSQIRHTRIETCGSNYTIRTMSLASSACSSMNCPQYYNVCNFIELHTVTNKTLDNCGQGSSFGQTFWIILTLYFITAASLNASMTFGDALVYTTLGDHRNKWGNQRFFGALAVAIVPLPVTIAMDIFSTDDINFAIVFYTSVCLMVVTAASVWFMKKPEMIERSSGRRETLKKLVRTILHIDVFLILIGLAAGGSTLGVVEGFRFWFLRDLGSSAVTLGVCLAVSTLSDMLFYLVMPLMLRRLSEFQCVCIALLMNAVRILCYSFITNPWYILIPSSLQGFTTSVMWSAGSCFAARIAPRGMIASLQSLFAGFLFGLGRGLGALLTGQLYDTLGSVWTFRSYSASITACLAFIITVNIVHKKLKGPTINLKEESTHL